MRTTRPRGGARIAPLLGLALCPAWAAGGVAGQEPAGPPDSIGSEAAVGTDVRLDAGRIRTGDFRYAIMLQSMKFGEYELRYRQRNGSYRLEEEASGHAGEQSGTYTFTRALDPIAARQEGSLGEVSAELRLRYEPGRVTGEATVPGSRPEEGGPPPMEELEIDTTLAEGTIDASMGLSAVLASPLSPDFELRLPVYDPRRGVVRLEARVTGEAIVEVPAGRFEAWRVEMTTGRAPLVVYVTREAPRMMVRQEFAGQPVVFQLEEIDG